MAALAAPPKQKKLTSPEKEKEDNLPPIELEEKPYWVTRMGFDEFSDSQLLRIVTFYVFNTPCESASTMGKSLKEHGWTDPWGSENLAEQLSQASNEFAFVPSGQGQLFLKALMRNGLYYDFPNPDMSEKEIVCFQVYKKRDGDKDKDKNKDRVNRDKERQWMSLFKRIRNAFAHGRFCVKKTEKGDMMVLEDEYSLKPTARMQIRIDTLIKWIDIIESCEQTQENITDGSNETVG